MPKEYAYIENGAAVRVRSFPDEFDPATVSHKFDLRPVVDLADEDYDEAAETLGPPALTVEATRVTRRRRARPLTPPELAAREAAADAAQERQELLTLVQGVGALNASEQRRLFTYLLARVL